LVCYLILTPSQAIPLPTRCSPPESKEYVVRTELMVSKVKMRSITELLTPQPSPMNDYWYNNKLKGAFYNATVLVTTTLQIVAYLLLLLAPRHTLVFPFQLFCQTIKNINHLLISFQIIYSSVELQKRLSSSLIASLFNQLAS